MKCDEVLERLSEYEDGQLPEVTRRRIDHHLEGCESCRADFQFWTESGKWIQAGKEQYASVPTTRSIVDAVMSRILSQEKWAIPIGRKVFTLTARMRLMGFSTAAILLLFFSVTLYSNANPAEALPFSNNEIVAMVPDEKADVVSAGIGMETEPDADLDMQQPEPIKPPGEIETVSPQLIPIEEEQDSGKPNFSFILSFFGILITILVLSWFSRVKDRS